MNNDYLWDKTGSDPEIENLETALKQFAHKNFVPRVPASAVPAAQAAPRSFFSFRFAFALACVAALGFIFAGLFINRPHQPGDELVFVAAPDAPTQPVAPEIRLQPSTRPAEDRPVFVKANTPPVRQTLPPAKRVPRVIQRKPTLEDPQVRMTNEEAYAYNQLMLALSITSSKLKLVKDKVDGAENPKQNIERYR